MYHSYILVPVLAVIPLIPIFFSTPSEINSLGSPLAIAIDTFFMNWRILAFIIGLSLLFFQSLYISRISEKHHLQTVSSNIPSLMILTFYMGITLMYFNLSFVIANTLMLICLDKVLDIYNQISVRGILFVSSACIGLASLLFFEYALFILIIYVGLFFFRQFNLREILIPLIGFLTPYIYLIVYLLSNDDLGSFTSFLTLWHPSELAIYLPSFSFWIIVVFAIFHALFVSIKTIRQKNHQNIILVSLIISILFQFVFRNPVMACYAALVPASLLAGAFFSELRRKWLAELLFSAYIFTLVISHVFLTS